MGRKIKITNIMYLFLLVGFTTNAQTRRVINRMGSDITYSGLSPDSNMAGVIFLNYKVKLKLGENFYSEMPGVKIFEVNIKNKKEKDITLLYLEYCSLINKYRNCLEVYGTKKSDSLNEGLLSSLLAKYIDSLKRNDYKITDLCLKATLSILRFYDTSEVSTYSIDITPLYHLFKSKVSQNIKYKIIISDPAYFVSTINKRGFCGPGFVFENFEGYKYIKPDQFKYETLYVTKSMLLK
jgi:hypothetical protein